VPRAPRSALGFRVRTGRTIAVLLAGPPDAPRVVWRDTLDLFDPEVPATIMPWHAALELPPAKGQAIVRRAAAAIRAMSARRVREVLERAADEGLAPRRAALVTGSLVDPASIANDHMRAHAEEGRLSREALREAAVAAGLRTSVLLEKEAWERGAEALGRRPDALRRVVEALGKPVGPPWGGHEKLAALAAWVALR
jgi:hypothetical protein